MKKPSWFLFAVPLPLPSPCYHPDFPHPSLLSLGIILVGTRPPQAPIAASSVSERLTQLGCGEQQMPKPLGGKKGNEGCSQKPAQASQLGGLSSRRLKLKDLSVIRDNHS